MQKDRMNGKKACSNAKKPDERKKSLLKCKETG